MSRKLAALAGELSLDDLRRLLAVKERFSELDARRVELESELAAIRSAVDDLMKGGTDGAVPARRGRGKARRTAGGAAKKKTAKKSAAGTATKRTVRRKSATKKAATKKVAAKKSALKKPVAKKRVAKKKVARKKIAKKKAVKKQATARKAPARKAAVGKTGKQTLESVVAGLIRAEGGAMSVQDILRAIAKGKLVKSRSRNFSNVLRRTLSTSKILVSAGRGLYKVK